MKPIAFQVLNFRSIVNSGWIPFSPDGVTIFVGQNESGKTSLLEALSCALGKDEITGDDCRTDARFPEVHMRAKVDFAEILPWLEERPSSAQEIDAVRAFLDTVNGTVELRCDWELRKVATGKEFRGYINLSAPELERALELLSVEGADSNARVSEEEQEAPLTAPTPQKTAAPAPAPGPAPAPKAVPTPEVTIPESVALTVDDLGGVLYEMLPAAVLFRSESGLLPNHVDIDEKAQPIGEGALAARNFLDIADINLEELLARDKRARETILSRANDRISAEFNSFWTQVIGRSGRLSLKCDVDYYSEAKGSMAGHPHVAFWISDGNTQLYPKQRSQGVRWFVSFYLQLKASEKSGKRSIFLLDEPGANLHSRAQADVLKLINKLSKDTSIVYTTHSPHMIEYSKLFRVHAVQRDGEKEDSPTVVIDAHRLGTASSDTLSPVLTAMGTDLSNQQVIRKSNNVLLEEMSGFYYLTAFWKLTNSKEIVHFIAATGVNKLEALANMFRGWGLDFIVAVDDDNQGRGVYNNLKKELFGDDEVRAKAKLLKFSGCSGIEDAFSTTDFKRYVFRNEGADIQKGNSEFLKNAGRSKPVMAFEFLLAVEQGKITWGSLEDKTREQITSIVNGIRSRLTPD